MQSTVNHQNQSNIPVQEQSISYEGRELTDPAATIASYRVPDNAMLLLRRKVTVAGRSAPIHISPNPFKRLSRATGRPNKTRR